MDKKQLIEFEKLVAETFNDAKIRAPIHLHGGNEEQLIDIFKKIKKVDWVFSSWRSHYHCLLKGVRKEILLMNFLIIISSSSLLNRITLLHDVFLASTDALV